MAPFKPQNMALNSAVTKDGGEIGRAQAVQAQAAGIEPIIDMNPVLLKPSSDTGAQIIIHGRAISSMEAKEYHDYKSVAMAAVMASHQRLMNDYQTVLVEGAGSPAEINLRDRDIANMGFAEKADCPVILIADIDKGGVFAHLVGTLELLSPSEQERVIGFVINRFRGDIGLLQSGLDWLEQRTGKPVLGVLPYLHSFHLEAEDAIQSESVESDSSSLHVAVPVLPRISNHTDFDVLRLHPQVTLTFVGPEDAIPPCDLIILPGSKSVISDLRHLREQGWDHAIARHLRYGGKLLGICGGFQMLGNVISDPLGIEGSEVQANGLSYLDLHTELAAEKVLQSRHGTLRDGATSVSGYEIHCGVTEGRALNRPLIHYRSDEGVEQVDGAVSDDEQIIGTYWHGLFDDPEACQALLRWAGLDQAITLDYHTLREQQIDRLADTLENCLDSDFLQQLIPIAE